VSVRLLPFFGFVLACAGSPSPSEAPPVAEQPAEDPLYPELVANLDAWARTPPAAGDGDRTESLGLLASWIAEKREAGAPAHLLFVCTHNSRRSHLGQLWAWAAARHAGLDHVVTWSGGTEATAFNPRAMTAARAHGFRLEPTEEQVGPNNPVIQVSVGPGASARAFSKTFGDPTNPSAGFAAVMVCSEADASCPFVPGAELRVSLPYLDPKTSDGTPEEASAYLAKSEEIGREMVLLMAMAKDHRPDAGSPTPAVQP
jgi:arsenate reductase